MKIEEERNAASIGSDSLSPPYKEGKISIKNKVDHTKIKVKKRYQNRCIVPMGINERSRKTFSALIIRKLS
ncbi:MAG: hypothetical protein ACFFCQ_10735 [Promethearchaeota archaeon]